MNNLIFRHKMHFNLRLRCKKCALFLPCVPVVGSSGSSFLWRKQELGLCLQKMLVFLVLVIFSRLLVTFLISVATICWSFALYLQGFRRILHPHIPCFPALPFSLSPSGCLTSSLSLCTNLAAERKRTRENLILLILITSSLLGKCLFLVLSVFWALASCLSEAGWARACFIYPEFEMVDKGTSSFSLSSPRVLEMLSGRKMIVTFDTALT